MMQITEITPTLAELAVSLAGFSAVIVALRPLPIASWSAFDRFNFRMLLQVAALTIFFSIFPFGTLALLDAQLAWQAAALAYGLAGPGRRSRARGMFPAKVCKVYPPPSARQ